MKKALNIFIASTLIGTATASIVACGVSPQKLMNRKINTEEYKGFMLSSLNTWSYPSTQQSSDSLILENLYDGLLSPNASGEMEGQLADWWGHDEEGKTYFFHLRNAKNGETDIPHWTKRSPKGNISKGEQIIPMDFFNTFRFDFNPNASAEGSAVTNELFKNGGWLTNFLSDLTEYDQANHNGENFARSSSEGGTASIKAEALSTRRYDTAIMLINLWSNEDYKIDLFQALQDNPIEAIYDAEGKVIGYEKNSAVEDFLVLINSHVINNEPAIATQKFNTLVQESAINGGMISVYSEDQEVQDSDKTQLFNIKMNLENPSSSFFESAASYGSLHPIPKFAVDYSNTYSWYNFSKKYEPSTTEMWFSGAYYLSEYSPTTRTILLKNPYYYRADKTNIKKATFVATKVASVDSKRLWFEGGDATEIDISPNDDAGWKKYVGDDYDASQQKFAFPGTHATTAIPSQYSFTTFYNYGRKTKEGLTNSSVAFSQKSVRLYLAYFLQRNPLASYISGRLDNEENTKPSLAWDKDANKKVNSSTMLRNVFTIPRLSVDKPENIPGKDYKGINEYDYTINNVGKKYNSVFGTTNTELANAGIGGETSQITDETSSPSRLDFLVSKMTLQAGEEEIIRNYYDEYFGSLIDGNDSYYHNDLMALGMFYDSENNLIPGTESMIAPFAEQAKKSVLDFSKNDKALDLQNENKMAEILANVIKYHFQNTIKANGFNENTKVELEWLLNSDARLTLNPKIEYMVDRFNNSVGSNSPIKLKVVLSNDAEDYKEKSKQGAYDIFVSGWGPDYTDPYNFLSTMTLGGAYNNYTNATTIITKQGDVYSVNSDYNQYASAFAELAQTFKKYDGLAEQAKETADFTERLEVLAETEVYGIYEQGMTATLYAKTPIQTIQLSYIDPFTRSSFIAGQSSQRLFGMKLIPQLWDNQKLAEAEANFKKSNDDPTKPEEYKNLYNWTKSIKPVKQK